MTRLPELKKNGTRENRNRGAMRHPPASRIPPTIGFHRKTSQTRRFGAERGFLRCGCGLNHKQPGDRPPRTPDVAGVGFFADEPRSPLRASRSMPLLRTGAISVAILR